MTFQLGVQEKQWNGGPYSHYVICADPWIFQFDPDVGFVMSSAMGHEQIRIVDSFFYGSEIGKRMTLLCGATSSRYSHCLRSSAHVASFIMNGSWISIPSPSESVAVAMKHLPPAVCSLCNQLPLSLVVHPDPVVLWPTVRPALEHCFGSARPLLDEGGELPLNIIVIGPTGSGKSHLVNALYNLSVCRSRAGLRSVTRNIRLTQGRWFRGRKVNVVDTIGFCDTELTPATVMELLKQFMTFNLGSIDVVVVVCADKIHYQHVQSLKQIMEWLKYDKNKANFRFIYNKCEQGSSWEQKQLWAKQMCSILGISIDASNSHLVMGVDLHPKRPVDPVEYAAFAELVLTPPSTRLRPPRQDDCRIL